MSNQDYYYDDEFGNETADGSDIGDIGGEVREPIPTQRTRLVGDLSPPIAPVFVREAYGTGTEDELNLALAASMATNLNNETDDLMRAIELSELDAPVYGDDDEQLMEAFAASMLSVAASAADGAPYTEVSSDKDISDIEQKYAAKMEPFVVFLRDLEKLVPHWELAAEYSYTINSAIDNYCMGCGVYCVDTTVYNGIMSVISGVRSGKSVAKLFEEIIKII